MTDNYKGYPTFNNVEDYKLQAYNRLTTMLNVNQDIGPDDAARYVELFDKKGKLNLALMAKWVQQEGRENVRKKINNGEDLSEVQVH